MSVTLEELVARLRLDSSGFDQGMSRVGSSTSRAGATLDRVTKRSVQGLAIGLTGIVANSVRLEASYSKTMRQVAIATDGPTGALDKLAKKMGADTVFSANDAAGAMLELAKGGMTAATIQSGALQATMKLASAGGVELADAATFVSNGLQTFHISAKRADDVTVALAGAANASSASVASLGQALAQGGLAAKNAGLNLQQTTGVLALFDANSLKGSDSGTSLKAMLSGLTPATDKQQKAMNRLNLDFVDAHGNFLGISQVAQQLHDRLGPLSEAQRAVALETIFGSDGMRAATILTEAGAKGVERYTKASRDQKTTSKLANAAMEGTSGALEKLQGAAETAQLELGEQLAPTVIKVADFLGDKALPAVSKFIGQMQSGTGAGGEFVSFLEDLYGAAKIVVQTIDSIPGPIKKMGAELLIAGVAVRQINGLLGPGIGALGRWSSAMATASTRTAATASASQRLGGVLRGAAGAGGLVLMADSAGRTSGALGTLEAAAGGALAGGAMGAFAGPPGAAIGAALGGLAAGALHLKGGVDSAGDSARNAITDYSALASTLDDVTGATTRATRQMVFQDLTKSKMIQTTRDLGLSDRSVVDAVVNGGAARERLSGIIEAQRANVLNLMKTEGAHQSEMKGQQLEEWLARSKVLNKQLEGLDALRKELGVTDKAVGAKKREIAATREFSKALDTLPKQVVTAVKAKVLSENEIARLIQKYNLARKDVVTLIRENGGKPTQATVQRLIDKAKEFGRQRPAAHLSVANPGGILGVIGQINSALNNAARPRTANITIHRANAGLNPALQQVAGEGPNSRVTSNGRTAGRVTSSARASGIKAGGGITAAIIAGLEGNTVDKVSDAMGKLNDVIRARAKKGAKAVIASTKDERTALLSAAKTYDTLTAKVSTAQTAYEDAVKARSDFSKSVREEAVGSIIAEGSTSPASLERTAQRRLAQVETFRKNFDLLEGKLGASDSILRQLADAGVEAGSATAAALVKGGPDSVKRMNDLEAKLEAASKSLGERTSGVFFDAGVSSAKGLVAGLKSQQAAAAKQADSLAAALVAAVRRRLKIKSPSRVFDDLGQQIGLGLQQGVERSRSGVQRSVARLVSVPELSTSDVRGATAGGGAYVPVHINAPQMRSDEQLGALIGGRVAAAVAGRGVVPMGDSSS